MKKTTIAKRRNDMDRSMKVMFGMMTVAICLLAFTMMGNQSTQVYAGEYVGGGDRGTEPTIVSFRVTPLQGGAKYNWFSGNSMPGGVNNTYAILLTRMWSDGAVEINVVGNETLANTVEGDWTDWVGGKLAPQAFSGWILITDSVAGYACAGDTDGNREVDVDDLLTLIEDWGQCEEDPPTNLAPDPDLS